MDHQTFRRICIYCLAFIAIALSVLGWDIYRLMYRPMIQYSAQPVIIDLNNTGSARQLVRTLKELNLIQSTRLLTLVIRYQGMSHHLKAGIYQINPGESAQHFLKRVVEGDVLVESFRIAEGTTLKTVVNALTKAPYLRLDQDNFDAIKGKHPSAEGLFLAETYQYDAGVQASKVLHHAHMQLKEFLNKNWANRAAHLPYNSPYELLIAASILEKEASLPEERYLISGVMINRLKTGMPLQMDPTVIYALGDRYQGKLHKQDMQIDSPFNTYKYTGLPPTPIAMVSRSSIEAAAHPKMTDYFYFVARGDGSHHFSETYEQHRKQVAFYRQKGR